MGCFRDYRVGLEFAHFGGVAQKQLCVSFPQFQRRRRGFVATKLKRRCVSNGLKAFSQTPEVTESGLFGFGVGGEAQCEHSLVLTEGEFDAMAIYEATEHRIRAVSLPSGSAPLSQRLIEQLTARHRRFVLFCDWDSAGQRTAQSTKDAIEEFATRKQRKIKIQIIKRPSQIKHDVKDANDILIRYPENEGAHIVRQLLTENDCD